MRKKSSPKFKVEVVHKETADTKDNVRQLWDLLVALPDQKKAPKENEYDRRPKYR
jgi:hypothetical protein